ncbi:RNA polymerase sigma factor [Amycolatopsis sp. H20-H5]|uniref:RNA polymerase sigma factor n=1 Tax=Amycolatopsis sp. H20-H5 TaxID=3046309 RepID=UPI002DBB04DA|nr:sigma-70 family RNA polymerase sigma factor [Amycolatopsis sp. H20-H5]MEC3975788.1 sigma-70 family RNA polymerase sigma factor [Amycolatopsis sp. H20-H5]
MRHEPSYRHSAHTPAVSAGQEAGETPGSTDGPAADPGALYLRYHETLRRYAVTKLPARLRSEADTALSIVFTRLVNCHKENQMPRPGNWEAYLHGAVHNACKDLVKARQHEEVDDGDPRIHRDAPHDPTADSVVEQDEHLEQAERADRAKAALDALDERSRAIVIAKHARCRTNKEIGEDLNLTGQRVGQLYKEAFQRLKEEVNRPRDRQP